MNKLLLVGGGGHCKSVLDAVLRENKYQNIGIIDPHMPVGTEIMGVRVVGNDSDIPKLVGQGYRDVFITVGSIEDTSLRERLYESLTTQHVELINIMDASAIISEDVRMGDGVFAGKASVINAGTAIDNMAIINTAAVVEHDCVVGAFSHISINATLCGSVTVGAKTFVGAGAVVTQGVTIGDRVVVGAGSVVLKDIPAGSKVHGVYKG